MPFHAYISTSIGATIALWQLTETSEKLMTLLSPSARAGFIEQKLSEKRLCERVATRLLLDSMEETRGITLAYTSEGAPYLLNKYGYISISHTRGWVTVAYHPAQPIGIDIECMGERVAKVAHRVLNNIELNNAIDSPLRKVWLHLCWSAKEALFKAIPENGIDFREHLYITPTTPVEEGELVATETRTPCNREYRLWYRVCDDFVLVCATPTEAQL